MNRSTVRSAGLALLLTVSGCGDHMSSGSASRMPGLNVAEAALQGGAGQIALQVSEGVLRESPNNARALEIKGDALTLLGDYDAAAAVFQALLAKDPTSTRANIGLGRIRLSKDPAGAEVLFLQVLRREPKELTALNNLGIARDLQGRHADAQTAYRQALAVDPNLESAQVNLALSMAMSGQGASAIQLLRTRATQPGAAVKVKHDYAVVLAMAGNRPEAERVLSADLSPEETRQVLDSVTGTRTRIVRDGATDSGRASYAARERDDAVPPDVVQVPEAAPAPPAYGRTARVPVPPPATAWAAPPPTAVMAAPPPAAALAAPPPTAALAAPPPTAALAAPPPTVIRPQRVAEPESGASVMQPVNPVAAAVANQRSLALPMQGMMATPVGPGRAADPVPDASVAAPSVIAMPPPPAARRFAAARDTAPETARIALPDGPPAPPALRPAPLPPAYQPPRATAHAEPPARQTATAAEAGRAVTAPPAAAAPVASASIRTASISVAPARAVPERLASAGPRDVPMTGTDTATSRAAGHDESLPMVQFVAAASEEAAHSFWQNLVHRFPDALSRREPVVMRFERGGTVFWRVRAEGFATMSEAQTMCARMRANGQECFVPRS